MAHVLTDEAFALSAAHFQRIGRVDIPGYWIAAVLLVFIPWNLAAIAGVLLASYTDGFDASIGGRNTLLLAVGAAVIGGTSLFGGKGRPLDAVIGGLVLAVITYGMSNLVKGVNGSAVQLIITGGVLVLAAAVDALARRRAGSRGL